MEQTDEITNRILALLEKDARTSYTEIARQLGISETTVRNRVKGLMKEGILKGFTVRTCPEKLGKAITAIVGVDIGGETTLETTNKLADIKEVSDLYVITGEFDLLLRVVCENISRLDEILEEIRSYSFVEGTRTFVVLRKAKESGLS